MGQKWNPKIEAFKTDANFASSAWFLVKTAGGGTDIDVCGAGELPLGVLTDNVGGSNTNDKYVDVQVGGIIKVIAGGSLTDGTLVASDASGEAVAAAAGDYYLGQCLQDAADGELASVIYGPGKWEQDT